MMKQRPVYFSTKINETSAMPLQLKYVHTILNRYCITPQNFGHFSNMSITFLTFFSPISPTCIITVPSLQISTISFSSYFITRGKNLLVAICYSFLTVIKLIEMNFHAYLCIKYWLISVIESIINHRKFQWSCYLDVDFDG